MGEFLPRISSINSATTSTSLAYENIVREDVLGTIEASSVFLQNYVHTLSCSGYTSNNKGKTQLANTAGNPLAFHDWTPAPVKTC